MNLVAGAAAAPSDAARAGARRRDFRGVAKGVVEAAAATQVFARLAAMATKRRVAVLAYHNVVPDAEAGRGDASLHLPLSRFIEQVDALAHTHDIVDLDAAAAPAPPHARPRAVITFDDAYRGAVTLALPELARRGLPSTMFVAPALLGAASTWWDEAAGAGLLSEAQRNHALTEHAGRADLIRAALAGVWSVPDLPTSCGIASLEELLHHAGDHVRVGSHTWAHEHLPDLGAAELRDTLARALDWLRACPARTTGWLALPYGGGSPAVEQAALDAGYAGVLRISGGLWNPGRGETRSIPRINVPAELTVGGLRLRTSGVRR